MAKLYGTHLALGVVAAVAAAGAVASRSRGSRALSSMTVDPNLREASQPWKAMVGAARGGESLEKWKSALRTYPLDIDLHVVGNRRDMGAWLRKVHRSAPGKLKIVVEARTFGSDPQLARRIEADRKQVPSDAFALMTPFTTMHRVFESSFSQFQYDTMPALALTERIGDVVSGGTLWHANKDIRKVFYEWAMEDCGDKRDAEVDACVKDMMSKWTDASSVYEKSQDVLLGGNYFIKETDEVAQAFEPYREKGDDHARVFSRVVVSLTCPTAAGRLMRLTDYSQAMADCYATWAIANRNPLVKLTEDDLRDFRVEKQIDRWLKSIGGEKNTTDVAIRRYRESLERVAVPVLRWVAENDSSGAIEKAVLAGRPLHAKREPLINACNEVLSIQRVLAI